MSTNSEKGTVATVGVFDGVHVGHVRILQTVSDRARDLGLNAAVLTFDPHPDEVLGKLDDKRFLLTTAHEKHVLLANLGIDIEMVLEFTRDIGQLDAGSFVKRYLLASLRLKELVIGHDFRMGKGRAGDRDMLRSLGEDCGFSVMDIEAVLVDGTPVSSTRVRQAVSAGDMELAARLLGRGYSVEGEVITGSGIGAQIGFPTANLSLDERKLIPPDGVYAAYADTEGGVYRAAVNIGVRPTVGGGERQLEAHMIGLRESILGSRMRLVLARRLRSERKFREIKDLRNAIKRDVQEIEQYLDNSTIKAFL